MKKIAIILLFSLSACSSNTPSKDRLTGKWLLHKIDDSNPAHTIAADTAFGLAIVNTLDTAEKHVMVGSVFDKDGIFLILNPDGTGHFANRSLAWSLKNDSLIFTGAGSRVALAVSKISGAELTLTYNEGKDALREVFKKL